MIFGMKLFYHFIFYPFGLLFALIFSFFHTKTRTTLTLKKNALKNFLYWALFRTTTEKTEYWVHVASYGELEYALPILEELELRQKHYIVTYFSVSAEKPIEELKKKMRFLSYAGALPHDGLWQIEKFTRKFYQIGGKKILLLKYELWPGLLMAAKTAGLKVFLVDALRPGVLQKPLLCYLSGALSGYAEELKAFDSRTALLTGDTRVERVVRRMEASDSVLQSSLENSLRQRLTQPGLLVLGSMWPADSAVVFDGLRNFDKLPQNQKFNVCWVPHELDRPQAEAAAAAFAGLGFAPFFLGETTPTANKPLAAIVFKKGILTELYKLGSAAFVGGAFGKGVHSVWEPAIAGCVISCGPKTHRSPESRQLQNAGLLTPVETGDAFEAWVMRNLATDTKRPADEKKMALSQVLKSHQGASIKIIDYCESLGT